MTIYIGQRKRSVFTFRLANGTPADPPYVLFYVQKPDLTESLSIYGLDDQPYEIVRDEVGDYHANILFTPVTPSPFLGTKIRWVLTWFAYDNLGESLDTPATKVVFLEPSPFAVPLPPIP